ncbi:arginase [Halobellus captivus]|uniref:arginase n=1 Tax=Halobellus captivus TaxID=2592614 RepID=UPI0011A10A84|nr:arginase [Halobellus captivus]
MTRTVRVVGAPTDYGANRRGVDMGPSAIRYAGLAEQLERADVTVVDDGDVRAPRAEERDPEAELPASGRAKFLRETREVVTALADRVGGALEADELPLVLGGDHSVAIGSVTGSARDAEIGVVWFDAHGDFNTPETSPSGNVHGMPLAAILGVGEFADIEWANAAGLSEDNVAIVGLRDVDETERAAIAESDVTTFTMSDIDERGIANVADDALDVAAAGTDGVHVSLDLDWLDPREAPGVGTPVRGGVTYREAHAALEAVAERDCLRSMELVEVNPILDERNETATLATELASSALGTQIL